MLNLYTLTKTAMRNKKPKTKRFEFTEEPNVSDGEDIPDEYSPVSKKLNIQSIVTRKVTARQIKSPHLAQSF